MAKEQPIKQEGESQMGNKRVNREVMPSYVVDTYDDGGTQKWCRGCGGIFFTENELKEKHKECDASNPEGGVESFLQE
ncbi:MAG: hypothetical protein A3F94_01690 [Candidatus Spechtbacteria bacterium RIFCSPLOWO2_12_FULL_38_22]|uniref:Transcription factor zinc-finger domain-containing protein n=1 Tax=Candidatus Spechtbacteria bacterium RIFCSPLOWO2_12_FULL_38_22 TaxID=1802165 RepID=A0A1G2HIY7_9BACT|nr:MAG: hypothetical protein A2728_01195 [Candidatus Spechtbacteria bacterium RIFCSPHIGHO2_01_FULL_38_11]OGZ59083.1 MAG: hypothetical protein A3E58_02320 [Candidatus Spechtbacteria bacterium RIFCSPHIGHO2_12_FULL_38_30]OGZ60718.1 MAG: hypothetical protein A3A00_01685 [Candidatus Spechtbacteria bacterium RIFCSPLOWO2_01_FULL_38_20]OGZ62476.1 MAG: hypothetical protein A3F94_01690 [Candidatus Spechtbacteria bacterium RIFCSPLOWO2_12_FULL_38_22]